MNSESESESESDENYKILSDNTQSDIQGIYNNRYTLTSDICFDVVCLCPFVFQTNAYRLVNKHNYI